jgi:hypothetical protein
MWGKKIISRIKSLEKKTYYNLPKCAYKQINEDYICQNQIKA